MIEVTVMVEAEINPTESEDNVRLAIANVVENAIVSVSPSGNVSVLIAKAEGLNSLVKLRNLLRSDRIRDAARKILFHSIRGNSICFCLNKQAAFAGHVSFSEESAESPLGPIRVTIYADSPRQVVEWLAEKAGREMKG